MRVTGYNNLDKVTEELEKLNNYSIEVGIFDDDSDQTIVMLATVHEFGVTIRPKKQYLTIPTPLAAGRKAREIDGLFKPKGKKILATTNKKGELQVMFYLVEEVVIPERSFIRSTFDEKEPSWTEYFNFLLGKVINSNFTAEEVFEQLGKKIALDIMRTIRNMSNPANAAATVARKRANNPLVDSGRLRQSVTWKVVSKYG